MSATDPMTKRAALAGSAPMIFGLRSSQGDSAMAAMAMISTTNAAIAFPVVRNT
jgi:hypothetical protein